MNCMPHARSPPLFALSNGRWRIYDDIDDVHVQVYIKQIWQFKKLHYICMYMRASAEKHMCTHC